MLISKKAANSNWQKDRDYIYVDRYYIYVDRYYIYVDSQIHK